MPRLSRYPLAAAQRIRAVTTLSATAVHAQARLDLDQALSREHAVAAQIAVLQERLSKLATQTHASCKARDLAHAANFATRLRAQLHMARGDLAQAKAHTQLVHESAEFERQKLIAARTSETVVDRHEEQWQANNRRTRDQRGDE